MNISDVEADLEAVQDAPNPLEPMRRVAMLDLMKMDQQIKLRIFLMINKKMKCWS